MENYTIAESFILPSQGKIYRHEVVPNIKLRSMTTAEEMRRLSPSDVPFENMCSVIDDCMIESPGISSYDMCIGDYQFVLYKLRIVTYGPDYPISTYCPFCGFKNADTVDLDGLEIMEYTEDLENYLEFDLPKTGKHVKLNVQTPRMMDEVTRRVKEFNRKSNGAGQDMTMVYTIESLIDEIDGKKPNPINITKWVTELPMQDTYTILSYADKINSSIGINVDLVNSCDICGMEYKTKLKTNNEFFRPAFNLGW